jgi:peptidyl-prolyl cis-trans isomerase SurA
MNARWLTALLITCALVASTRALAQEDGAAAQPPAGSDIIERIVAVVNDDAVFLSELRARSVPYLDRVMSAPSQAERIERREALYAEVLGQLIDEQLIEQAAEELEIRVTSTDVERAIATVRRQNNLDEPAFWQAVRAQGYSEAGYRADLQRQLLRMRLLNQRVRSRVNITEEDVRAEYDQTARRRNRTFRFRASHVFVPVGAEAAAPEVATARRQAEEIRVAVTDEATLEAAITANQGGSLGWLRQGDLPELFETTLLALEEGVPSEPVRGPNGFHIFYVHERERGEEAGESYEDARERIYQELLDTAMTRQEELYLGELRRNADIDRRL